MTKMHGTDDLVTVEVGATLLEGLLRMPEHAIGVVLFAHGSGSSRFSPRNNYVASRLLHAGIATLLVDLLTEQEDQDYSKRFEISLLIQRLYGAAKWLRRNARTSKLPLGLFGASTGAAAALEVAAQWHKDEPDNICAIVSRGGRPDLASREALEKVSAPTLLIVGGMDGQVIEFNQKAYSFLRCEKQLEIVPGATHLFEESGALTRVSELSIDWFLRYMK